MEVATTKEIPTPSWWNKLGAKLRGTAVPMPSWWIRLARGLAQKDDRSGEELGQALARLIKRPEAYDTSVINNFRAARSTFKNDKCTLELAVALCLMYRLPWPIFFPQSHIESIALGTESEKYADVEEVYENTRLQQLRERTALAVKGHEPTAEEVAAVGDQMRRRAARDR